MNKYQVIETAAISYEANRIYCFGIGEVEKPAWWEAEQSIRDSTINGVKKFLENPSISPEELHEEWCSYKKNLGWTYGPKINSVLKQHPCLLLYSELPETQKAKDSIFRGICVTMLGVYDRLNSPS